MAFIKCLNCGKTEFKTTVIGDVSSIDGCCFRSTINAYACQNCGHIELFEPSLDLYAKHLILKSEEERTGVTRTLHERRRAMDPKSERKSRYDFDTEILMNVDDFIDYRVNEREKIKNKHFTGDIGDDKNK